MNLNMIYPMVKQLIKAGTHRRILSPKLTEACLEISELFYDSIQGEGITTGHPAAFLRLAGCTLDCVYCDTKAIRDEGSEYHCSELLKLMEEYDSPEEDQTNLITRLKQGQHLVITGGSPLKQQGQLLAFLETFIEQFGFKPFIELENECTLVPNTHLIRMVDVWNNSPKLSNSGNSYFLRYKPDVIRFMSCLPNTWFKFVICSKEDWIEIYEVFLRPRLILKEQIILMPQGKTREELLENSELVVQMAIRENVRFSQRNHVILWNTATGI